jgi:SAM-dependent methyltransferase
MNDATNLFADGEAYERLMGRWSRLVGDAFIDWLDAPKGLRWLDLGCGNGAFTERLIDRCGPAAVTAIDPSKEQLAYARARPGTKLANFQLGDAQKLPFADGSFDAAAMALVITFLPDPAKAVAEMARVVRPGGWIATYMWDVLGGGLPNAPIFAAIKALGLPSPYPPGSAASRQDAMLTFWEKAGLKSMDVRAIRITTSYVDFEDFWRSNAVGVGPLGKAIDEMAPSMREKIRSQLRESLVTGSDGRVTCEAFANAVKGRAPE